MRKSTHYLSTILLLFSVILFLLGSCRSKQNDPEPIGFWNVPEGGTAVIENTDLSGRGLLTNRANTTWVIRGFVRVDDLSVIGRVILVPGAVLQVNGLINVAGGAFMTMRGTVTCNTLTQVGKVFFDDANVQIFGQYTAGGGTAIYLQNSLVKVNDLRLLGSVYALENESTQANKIFSVFHFTGPNIYLNRAAGTTVCGPVLFTYNNDQGTSGIALNNHTSEALAAKSDLREVYSLPSDILFYRYADEGCTPIGVQPAPL